MKDIRFINLLRYAKVSNLSIVNASARTARITGEGFADVKYILFSDQKIESFVVKSLTELEFQLPPPPMDLEAPIRVIVGVPNEEKEAAGIGLSFDSVNHIEGKSRIVQKFLKLLLTEKGSSIHNRNEGTFLMQAVGQVNPTELTKYVTQAVQEASQQVILSQSELILPASELFVEARLIFSNFNANRASIEIVVEIETADGLAYVSEVEL